MESFVRRIDEYLGLGWVERLVYHTDQEHQRQDYLTLGRPS
jgi:hypothetical protein